MSLPNHSQCREPTGVIFDIKRYAVHDGPGIRITLFFKGCGLRCWWCHNPESQRKLPEICQKPVTLDNRPTMTEPEEVGRWMTVSEAMTEIRKELIFIDESGGGVTFSGGEPLLQTEFLLALLRACRAQEIHTVLDTSGHGVTTDVFRQVIAQTDLVLFDVKLVDTALHRRYTGASNRAILANLQALDDSNTPYVVRYPTIPTINDGAEHIAQLKALLSGLNRMRELNLLPYHDIANHKYQRFHKHNKMGDIRPPADARMADLQREFTAEGYLVKIGG